MALGNAALLEALKVSPAPLAARAEELRLEGETVMFVTVDGALVGLLGVADPVKPSAAAALRSLHDEGVRVVMLTGDSQTTAEAVAKKLGIDQVIAGVLPEAKGKAIAKLQQEGRVVAMAGDGVNDAPALAQANVGIAMGTGTDVAIESAGVTLVKGDLGGIARARALNRATMRNIRRHRHPDSRGRAVPVARAAAQPDDRERGDEPELRVRHRQRAQAPEGETPRVIAAPTVVRRPSEPP